MNKLLLLSLLCCCCLRLSGQVNLSSGLVAYYPFNGTFNDASGNGNNATAMNGTTFGTDQWGNPNNAAFFDGINDWLTVAHPNFTFGHNFTLAFRFKTSSAIHQVLMAESDYNAGFTNLSFQVAFNHPTFGGGLYLGSNHNGTCTTSSTGNFDDFGTAPSSTGANQWYCAVMTFNNGVKKVFINGILAVQHTVTNGTRPTTVDSCLNANVSFRMGAWWSVDPRYFSGLMDEVRLYGRTLNSQEIDSVCNLATVLPGDTVINKYAAVTGRAACGNTFTVDTATGFNAGDTLLIMQMKGATIDTTNTSSFGSVLAYNGAGNYEYNVVQVVAGNNITLRNTLLRSYDMPGGSVQFVKVPSYTSYAISQRHTCLPWTGTKGGVFAIRSSGTITMNADINVSGKGFRGGIANTVSSPNNVCHVTDYYNPPNVDTSAQKGEGITMVSAGKSYGRGSLASGGGGGNAHNSGGGGGGNAGAGGLGGMEYQNCSGVPATNSTGRVGGVALSYTNALNKVFLGGGGGAGHANDLVFANGGAGGGIVIIQAGAVAGNGFFIKANGAAAPECTASAAGCANDGTGGGGGGGAILISASSVSSAINTEATGGKGANVYLMAPYLNLYHGPGGGGGGGAIWKSSAIAPAPGTANTAGGANGSLPQYGNASYGATAGSAGQNLAGLQLPIFGSPAVNSIITVGFTDSVISCFTRKFINTSAVTSAIGISYMWSFGGGGASTQRSPVFTFPGYGYYTVTLTITDSASGCSGSVTRNIDLSFIHFAKGLGDTITCNGKPVYLNALGGISYSWTPAATLATPTAAYTKASPSVTTTYIVTVTDNRGCIDSDDVVVKVNPPAVPVFATPSDTVVCRDTHVPLHATGAVSYQWTPADGLSNANSPNPVATIAGMMQYVVTGVDAVGCTSTDTVTVHQYPGPDVHAASQGIVSNCNHVAAQLSATGNAVRYEWAPAIYVANSTAGATAASPPVTTTFILTGKDAAGCSSTDTTTVFVDDAPVVFMPNAFSPNGDSHNDEIHPMVYCDFTLDEYRIYNRWGQLVFEASSVSKAWNGYFGGKPAEVGTYSYLIIGKQASTAKQVMYKGNFLLLR